MWNEFEIKRAFIFPPAGTRIIQELKRQVDLEKTRSLLQTIPFCFLVRFYAALRDTVITKTLNVIFKSLFSWYNCQILNDLKLFPEKNYQDKPNVCRIWTSLFKKINVLVKTSNRQGERNRPSVIFSFTFLRNNVNRIYAPRNNILNLVTLIWIHHVCIMLFIQFYSKARITMKFGT